MEEVESNSNIVSVVSYDSSLNASKKPILFHVAGKDALKTGNTVTSYSYPETSSGSFIIPGHKDFLPSPASVAHSRTLTFLKKHMGGPFFDLEAIWDEHTEFEFGNRSVANTMGTMVQEPYVNHIPTVR
jgi:carboxymethylenebutenolidase